MALRPLASGTVSFGLVAIPVKLYTTTESAKSVSFNNVHKECGTRVKYRYFCPTDDRLVERSELTKGYEFAKGKFVLLEPEELKAIHPEPTNAIEIKEFVPLEEVDPIFFEKSYFLGPDKGGAKPYQLLSNAMRQTQRAAVARYQARGKNHLVVLRPFDDGLIMQQLHYADELRSFEDVPMDRAEVSEAELGLALQLIDQIASDTFRPELYKDEVRQQTWDLIERKIQGEDIVAAPQEEPKAQIIDLMEALKASLGGDEGRKAAKSARGEADHDEDDRAVASG